MNNEFWEQLARSVTHTTKMRILEVFKGGGTHSPNGLSIELGEPLGNISYHVKVLEKKGLLELDHTVPRRGAVEHFYRASERVLAAARVVVGPSEEIALNALEDPLFEAMGAGVNAAQVAQRFEQLEAREAGEAVAV